MAWPLPLLGRPSRKSASELYPSMLQEAAVAVAGVPQVMPPWNVKPPRGVLGWPPLVGWK